tara:strand:+ start:178 stop:351 length:174 start_codon:yes stop_codon:yes gene_type:complete
VHVQAATAKLAVRLLFKKTAKVSVLTLAPMATPMTSLAMMPQVLVVAVVVDSPPVCT